MTPLSPNFSLEELTFSEMALRRGWKNDPSPLALENLKRLCETLLEPIRAAFGVPIHVNSGYRSAQINKAVGGATGSAHMIGRAADIVPIGIPLQMAFDHIRQDMDLPYERMLFECNSWIHIQVPPPDVAPMRLAFTASGGPGNWIYAPVT